MPILEDAQFEEAIGDAYGRYLATFNSENRQVRVDMFEQGDWLVAHVSFPTGLGVSRVTDPYLSDLQSFATKKGFDGKLRLLYS